MGTIPSLAQACSSLWGSSPPVPFSSTFPAQLQTHCWSASARRLSQEAACTQAFVLRLTLNSVNIFSP